ncbi:DUF3265 domain-containing protein [Plesiomonas shigelloides]|nr:DUF3265 domain-containing protein [Plesiomonas shigelloides]
MKQWSKYITNCLREIRSAWHFNYALVLVFKVVCSGLGIALLPPQQSVKDITSLIRRGNPTTAILQSLMRRKH